MTSLQLFEHSQQSPKIPEEWGSGKAKGEQDIWLPRTPTWHQQNIPVQQFYDLTELKRSNLRDNDQLLPRPEASNMGSLLINKSFPSEHPYDSHISKFSVFPNFTSPQDPVKGVAAQTRQPIHAETPANSYDVHVIHKTKGAGIRHEVLSLPPESLKKPLYWNGENNFDQVVKTHGNRQTFYPTPQKSVAPNHQIRPLEHQVSEKTANTLKNVERSHWLTSNRLDYSGLGPSNSMKLDNLDEKKEHYLNSGEMDDNLYPHFANTFDPPRPVEGRIARLQLAEKKDKTNTAIEDSGYGSLKRNMTATDIEEDRFWNGKEYVNLPDVSKNPGADTRWQEIDQTNESEAMFRKLKLAVNEKVFEVAPYPQAGSPVDQSPAYLAETKAAQDKRVQEIEAQNRWRVLESHTPRNDLNSLHYKYGHLKDKELPETFYNHEGKYNEERAGMYKTSFDPHRLTHVMNKDETSGSVMFDTSRSHEDALYMPTPLSIEHESLLRRSKTFCGNTPRFSGDRQTPRNVSAPYHELRRRQKEQLQPLPQTAEAIVQEGQFILKDSTTGDSYNTHKFLQDHDVLPSARREPLNIMSHENQNLKRVPSRARSLPRNAKSVQFADKVTIAHMDSSQAPFQINSTTLRDLTDDEKTELVKLNSYKVNTTQYSSTQAAWNKHNENNLAIPTVSDNNFTGYQPSFGMQATPRPTPRTSRLETTNQSMEAPTEVEKTVRQQPGTARSEYRNEYPGESSNAVPACLQRSSRFRSSYQNQFPIYHDMSSKSDPRFDWVPGNGTPRPQTCLLALQDSFSKTDIKLKFNAEYPEKAPEIRNHITQGKKHVFNGVHGQLIHG